MDPHDRATRVHKMLADRVGGVNGRCPVCGKRWPLDSLALDCCTTERAERLERLRKKP